MNNKVKVELTLTGEPAFFLQMVMLQTGMESGELFSKMIDLYKQVYLNEYELAWIEGDIIKQKLDSSNLKRKTT
jgi:hypothetical protein